VYLSQSFHLSFALDHRPQGEKTDERVKAVLRGGSGTQEDALGRGEVGERDALHKMALESGSEWRIQDLVRY
jgi:hypothetical protein